MTSTKLTKPDLSSELVEVVDTHMETMVETFYYNLLKKNPDLVPAFSNGDIHKQKREFISALNTIFSLWVNEKALSLYLADLGVRHITRSVRNETYDIVIEELMLSLEAVHGALWTGHLKLTWRQTLNYIADSMKLADAQVEKKGA